MIFLALLACSQETALTLNTGVPDVVSRNVDGYQLVVYPAQSTEADGSVRAYPARITDIQLDTDIGVNLQRPVPIQGSIIGLNATPSTRARLPGTVGPVDATVSFRTEDVLEDLTVRTDEAGDFTAWLTPGAHEVLVVPASGLIPPQQFAFDSGTVDAPPLDLDLREFVPVWGRVTEAGGPKRNAGVRLLFSDGSTGPTVYTDDDGWYELRATEGLSVGLATSGSGNRVDPTLTHPPATLGPLGLRQDFTYTTQTAHTLSARIVADDDTPLSGLPFRLRSTSIDAYPEGSAEITGFTDTVGNLTTRALAGTYELTLLLEQSSRRTSIAVEVQLDDTVDLGDLQLLPLVSLEGAVLDVSATLLAGTVVECTEIGFSSRSWSTTTDADGAFSLDVPQSPLSCSAAPGSRTDLATRRVEIDPRNTNSLTFALSAGRRIFGTVQYEGQPEEFSLVEVTDENGFVWATALTDSRGAFELRIEPVVDL